MSLIVDNLNLTSKLNSAWSSERISSQLDIQFISSILKKNNESNKNKQDNQIQIDENLKKTTPFENLDVFIKLRLLMSFLSLKKKKISELHKYYSILLSV
jgi:hypothetical protein